MGHQNWVSLGWARPRSHLDLGQECKIMLVKFSLNFVCLDDLKMYCTVLFIIDFTYDVLPVTSKQIIRDEKARLKSSVVEKGEIVKVKGHLSKIMRVGK